MTRVAVVAADPMVRSGLHTLLRRAGDLSVVAEAEPVDVVLLDVWPPEEAEALCRYWRGRQATAALVAVVHRPCVGLAVRLGATLWPKDGDPHQLPAAVRAAARRLPGHAAPRCAGCGPSCGGARLRERLPCPL